MSQDLPTIVIYLSYIGRFWREIPRRSNSRIINLQMFAEIAWIPNIWMAFLVPFHCLATLEFGKPSGDSCGDCMGTTFTRLRNGILHSKM